MCESADGFARLCPRHVEPARLLLNAVIHAPNLGALRALRCIGVSPTERPEGGYASVTMGLEEVEMRGCVLSKTGRPLRLVTDTEFWEQAGGQEALLVEDLAAGGHSLVRVAG